MNQILQGDCQRPPAPTDKASMCSCGRENCENDFTSPPCPKRKVQCPNCKWYKFREHIDRIDGDYCECPDPPITEAEGVTSPLLAFGWLQLWCERAGISPLMFLKMWELSFSDKLAAERRKGKEEVVLVVEKEHSHPAGGRQNACCEMLEAARKSLEEPKPQSP